MTLTVKKVNILIYILQKPALKQNAFLCSYIIKVTEINLYSFFTLRFGLILLNLPWCRIGLRFTCVLGPSPLDHLCFSYYMKNEYNSNTTDFQQVFINVYNLSDTRCWQCSSSQQQPQTKVPAYMAFTC